MERIDWSKAPEWADRVVRSPRQRQLFWADDNSRQYFVTCMHRQDKQHVRDNWEVVERRPTADTGIDWSKAPHWADRVVRGGTLNMNYWASDCMLQPVNNSCPPFKTNNHIRNRLPVVERRPVPKNIDVRAAFATAKPLVTFSHPCNAEPTPITIEQRIASLRVLEKQVEETRAELTRDLDALGLTWMVRDDPEQPTITDWRDLRVGDIVEYVHGTVGSREGQQGEVCEIDEKDHHNRVRVMFNENEDERSWCSNWRFIRRP